MEFHMLDLDQCDVMRDTLESSDVAGGGAQLFLYQSGYLTIKHSDEFGYVIGFPNEEVRQALYNLVLPALTLRAGTETLKQWRGESRSPANYNLVLPALTLTHIAGKFKIYA